MLLQRNKWSKLWYMVSVSRIRHLGLCGKLSDSSFKSKYWLLLYESQIRYMIIPGLIT